MMIGETIFYTWMAATIGVVIGIIMGNMIMPLARYLSDRKKGLKLKGVLQALWFLLPIIAAILWYFGV